MDKKVTDEVLAHLDDVLAEKPVTCWKCGVARGEPSMCFPCREEFGWEKAPADLERVPWQE